MGSQIPTPEPGGGGLDDLRKLLAEKSGHLELVTDYNGADYSDNGADLILNAAQRMLDRELPYRKEDGWLFQNMASSSTPVLVTFENARVVKRVRIKNSAGGYIELDRTTHPLMFNNNPVEDSACIPPANSWCHTNVRMAPVHDGETAATYPSNDMQYVVFGDTNWPVKGIVVNGPEEAYELWVLASWHSSALSDAQPISFWTYHPELLMRAARIQMEIDHRNTQGYIDLMTALQYDIKQIHYDLVHEDNQGPPERFRMQS